jgi:hypothetical protein
MRRYISGEGRAWAIYLEPFISQKDSHPSCCIFDLYTDGTRALDSRS